jgi:hypothetical protein
MGKQLDAWKLPSEAISSTVLNPFDDMPLAGATKLLS